MKKVERENMCHDYNIQIQKIVSNVASIGTTESCSVKNKAWGLLQKVSIWRQNALFNCYFVYMACLGLLQLQKNFWSWWSRSSLAPKIYGVGAVCTQWLFG
jgi:hypothetical protein